MPETGPGVRLLLPVASLLGSLLLAVALAARGPRSPVRRLLGLGFALLAAGEACKIGWLLAPDARGLLDSEQLRLFLTSFLPAVWLRFSVAYSRLDPSRHLHRWRWLLRASLLLPVATVLLGQDRLYHKAIDDGANRLLLLGPGGKLLLALLTLGAVMVLMNLEWTLRASTGVMRWRIKYTVLGLGGLHAAQVYADSQTLLFASLGPHRLLFHSAALLVAMLLIAGSLAWTRTLEAEVRVSDSPPWDSVTLLAAAIYLLAAGILPLVGAILGVGFPEALGAFSLFLSVLVLTVILLSDRLRRQLSRFFNRVLARPHYDYRAVWLDFTRRTGSVVDVRSLGDETARMVADIFGVPAVSVWLVDEAGDVVSPGSSTVFAAARARQLVAADRSFTDLVGFLRQRSEPVDFAAAWTGQAGPAVALTRAFLDEARIRWAVTLSAGGEMLGILTLSERTTGAPFSIEDQDLLKTIADQAAASMLHFRLAERLLRARQWEAFQSLSAFFVHDLKNLASTLSMAMQNLPGHWDDPAFRDDLLQLIRRSVGRIDGMCGRLSPLSRTLELRRVPTDLNQVVAEALTGLETSLTAPVVRDLSPLLPPLDLDGEQMQKVVVNLVLNASEAMDGDGEVRLRTEASLEAVTLAVTDRGRGMSKEFVARSLFQPFQTTKKQGLGIGLFHSRKIVEAHGGRIEVDSVVGQGSTFRVRLPRPAPGR